MPPHPDAFYTAGLDAASGLSANSKRTYSEHLRMLQHLGSPAAASHHLYTLDHVVRHPKSMYALICAKSAQSMSRMSYISAVLTLFRHIPELAERYPRAVDAWRAHLAVESSKAAQRYDNNEPTAAQLAAHVPWADVLKARDALSRDSIEYLLMAMYTMIPPLRADFDRLAILHSKPNGRQVAEETPNYVLIEPASTTLFLNAYKTRKNTGHEYSKVLPPQLRAAIDRSLGQCPRAFLFTQPRSGEPFSTPHAYTVFAGRIFKRVLHNPHASTNTLRHSYITALPDRMKVGVRDQIARDMLHTTAMSYRYRLDVDSDDDDFDPATLT